MISRLELKNFTVFAEAKLDFSPQLNVIVGENGTGKTHLLKVMYVAQRQGVYAISPSKRQGSSDGDQYIKLLAVMRVEKIENLARNNKKFETMLVNVDLSHPRQHVELGGRGSKSTFVFDEDLSKLLPDLVYPVYLPTRELISIYPNFVSVYETTQLEFDETWRDTAVALGAPLKKNLDAWAKNILSSLEQLLAGEIVLNGGRFYLKVGDSMREAPLLAEGHRKLAMLAQLIANGSIQKGSVLFWDEPEANLNPKLVRQVAEIVMVLAREGVQIFIATHSLFLLRELEILGVMENAGQVQTRFFGLHASADGVKVMQGDSGDDIGDITALDEELRQTDRFLEANDVAAERLEQGNKGKKRKRSAAQ